MGGKENVFLKGECQLINVDGMTELENHQQMPNLVSRSWMKNILT